MEIPPTMAAVLLTGPGDFDKLEYRTDVPVPEPAENQVLIRVRAAGVNNTDVNTRIGWYSKSVTGNTADAAALEGDGPEDGGWGGALAFPRIQGADACGEIVAVGEGVDPGRVGERVIVSTMQRHPLGDEPWITAVFGSEFDGGFAQYAVADHREAHAVDCDWTDVELASIPCAYSTAENMLHRIELGAERVLITGASGGVGSAAIQLAARRGATITAICSAGKADGVRALGADRVIDRNADLVAELGENSIDVVVDLVAGPSWGQLIRVLRIGGRYITAGAIGGPLVELDIRDLYLKDLTLKGSTYQQAGVFENLVGYIERGEIKPIIAGTYPLSEIVQAQTDFLAKRFIGKLVLVPPAD